MMGMKLDEWPEVKGSSRARWMVRDLLVTWHMKQLGKTRISIFPSSPRASKGGVFKGDAPFALHNFTTASSSKYLNRSSIQSCTSSARRDGSCDPIHANHRVET